MNENTSQAIGDHAFHRNLHQAQTRSAVAAYLLWFFLGSVGAHLMYTRRWVMLAAHYLLLVLVGFSIGMVLHGKEIHNVFLGLAAVWGAILPFGVFSFLGMCILFAQVNYCNEDSALRLAGQKTRLTRVTERLVIIVSVGVFLMFAVIMTYFPDAPVRNNLSTTPDATTAPSVQTPSVQPSSSEVSSAPAANVEEGSAQPQVQGGQPEQVPAEMVSAQEQSAQPATAGEEPSQNEANTQSKPVLAQSSESGEQGHVYQTSFDCAAAKLSAAEQAICHNPELASLDMQLTEIYKNSLVMISNASAVKSLARSQFSQRAQCADDVQCLKKWYEQSILRFNELRHSAGVN
jgi:hypothetical protein